MFELLVLTSEWFLNENADHESLQNVTNVINRAYNKLKFKYGIIIIDRVESASTFARDFGILPGSYADGSDMSLYLLLGPKEIFDKLNAESGYFRDFNVHYETVEGSSSCDIPEKYASLFDFAPENVDMKINVVDKHYKFTRSELNRCLGTLGIRVEEETTPPVKNVEITAFTSYLKNAGSKLLEIVIQRCLVDPELLKNRSGVASPIEKIIIQADFVKEHNLERFYTRSGFKQSSRKDFVIPAGPASDVYGRGIMSHTGYSVASFEREVTIK